MARQDAGTDGPEFRLRNVRAMDVDAALAELRRCAGSQFDPACVELLAEALAPPPAARA